MAGLIGKAGSTQMAHPKLMADQKPKVDSNVMAGLRAKADPKLMAGRMLMVA